MKPVTLALALALVVSSCKLDEKRASTDEPFPSDPAAAAAASARPLPQNLLRNPSFELLDASRRPIEWNVPATPLILFDGKGAHSGNVAVGSSPTSYYSATIAVSPARPYTLGYYSRSELPGRTRLQINWALADGNVLSSSSVAPTTAQWAWNEYTATAPPLATAAAIYLVAPDETLAWYDDVWFGPGRRAHQSIPQ